MPIQFPKSIFGCGLILNEFQSNWSKAVISFLISTAVEPIYLSKAQMFVYFWQIISNQWSNMSIGLKGYINWVNVIKSLNHRDYSPFPFMLKQFFVFQKQWKRSSLPRSSYTWNCEPCSLHDYRLRLYFALHIASKNGAGPPRERAEKYKSVVREFGCVCTLKRDWLFAILHVILYRVHLKIHCSHFIGITSTNLLNGFQWYLRHFDVDFNTHFPRRFK